MLNLPAKITFVSLVSLLFVFTVNPLQDSESEIQYDGELSLPKIIEKPASEQHEIFGNMDKNTRHFYAEKYKNELSELTSNENIQRLGFLKGENGNQASGMAKILLDDGMLFLKLERFIISDKQIDELNDLSIFIVTNDSRQISLKENIRIHSDYSEHKLPDNISLDEIRSIEIKDDDLKTIVNIKVKNPDMFNEWLSIFPEQLFYSIPVTDTSSITSGRMNLDNRPLDVDICSVDFSGESRKVVYLEGKKMYLQDELKLPYLKTLSKLEFLTLTCHMIKMNT